MRKRKPKPPPVRPSRTDERLRDAPRETGVAEILTVAWMLTLLCTFGAEVLCLAILAIARPLPPRASSPLAGALTGGLLLASLVSGLACLLLTPVVWRLRAVKPPPAVTIGVVLVGLMPMVTLVVLYWLNS